MPSPRLHPRPLRAALPAAVHPVLYGALHAALPLAAALLTACGGGSGEPPASDTSTASTLELRLLPALPPPPPAAAPMAAPQAVALPAAAPPPGAAPAPAPQPVPVAPAAPESRVQLGRQIFHDPNLSEPRGTACVACHQPQQGFAGNHGSPLGVALGSQPGALGLRNSMGNGYAAWVPRLAFQATADGLEPVGGLFWDGRADTLAQQALGPLLNPLEMNNPSMRSVVDKVAASPYAGLFRQEFGAGIFGDVPRAFAAIGQALDAFGRSQAQQPFTSKYDAVLRGQTRFTPAEARGMALFRDPAKGNCAACHQMNPASGNPADSLFTDFSYYAHGVPRNRAIPRNRDPGFYDLGLCGPERSAPATPPGVDPASLCGKFRMPTLRNVAERPAYMHNGFFRDLTEVVRFYATRAVQPQRWWGPEAVPDDLPARYRGNLETAKAPFNRPVGAPPALTEAEVLDVVAFLRTLSDGWTPPR